MIERGLCCQKFILKYGPEELYNMLRWRKRADGTKVFVQDGRVMLEILRYIGYRPWTFAGYSPEWRERRSDKHKETKLHFYTCIRFDHKTGRCKHHDLRPHMCRIYNHGFCEHTHRCDSTDCSEHPVNVKAEVIELETCTKATKKAISKLDVEHGRVARIG